MRLFVSIEPPEKIKNFLKKMQNDWKSKMNPSSKQSFKVSHLPMGRVRFPSLREEKLKATFVNPEIFHITVSFLGEVEEGKIHELKTILAKASQETTRFYLTLDQLKVLPQDRGDSLIISLKEDGRFTKLQERINRTAGEILALPLKKKPPHLTLFRAKEKIPHNFLTMDTTSMESLNWEVNCFYLVQSTLTKDGPNYQNLEKFNLK